MATNRRRKARNEDQEPLPTLDQTATHEADETQSPSLPQHSLIQDTSEGTHTTQEETPPKNTDITNILAQMAHFQLETRESLENADRRRRRASDARDIKRTENKERKEQEQLQQIQAQRDREEAAIKRDRTREEEAQKRETHILQLLSNSNQLLATTMETMKTYHTQSQEDAQTRKKEQQQREDTRDKRHMLQHCPTMAKLINPEGMEPFLTSFPREHANVRHPKRILGHATYQSP